MQFALIHEIKALPGRLRTRTSSHLTKRQAILLADAISNLNGIFDVCVNHLTGSVLFHYKSVEARNIALNLLSSPLEEVFSRPLPKESKKQSGEHTGLHIFPFIHYFIIRPLLPIKLRHAIAIWHAIPYIIRGVASLTDGKLKVEALDASAIGVSILRRDLSTASTIIFLLGIGDMLENWTKHRSLSTLADSLALNVSHVWKVGDDNGDYNKEELVPLAQIKEGDVIIVRAGSTIPVDGVIVDGEGAVNQASLTGEPLPVLRSKGVSVYAGTVLEEGEIRVKSRKIGSNTRIQQIVNFIHTSESAKANVQGRSERLADLAVPFSFMLCGLVWLLTRNLTRVAAVLLVDYACALRMSTPLIMLTAMRCGVQNGVLIKGGRYLEECSQIDTIVFDKTGTLTNAHPSVADVFPAEGYDRDEVLRLAACLEEHFPHPVARAVVNQALRENLRHEEEHTEVKYVVAHGVASEWNGKIVLIGSRHYIEQDSGIDISPMQDITTAQSELGRSLLYLAIGDKLAGIISIEDPLRPEASIVIKRLNDARISTVMLTGDDERTASAVARILGISAYQAHILPEGKAEIVSKLRKAGHKVAMIGDGINDSPALSAANLGISLSDGTDIAKEVANIVLCQPRLENLLVARHISCAAMRRIESNFKAIILLNSLFMIGGAIGLLTPARSGLLHNITTVGTTLNAMRPLQDK